MINDKKNIVIAGAGLVGSMWACYMAKRGHDVHVLERRADMRKQEMSAGKSINLALSTRGWNALKKIGLEDELLKISVPMHGRMIHQEDGTQDFQAYGKEGQYIYSISRGELNKTLMNKADENDHIHFKFNSKCSKIDLKNNKVYYLDENKEEKEQSADLIFGADGAFSAVRYKMQKTPRFNYSQRYLKHAYKELSIPANEDGTHRLEKNALHIWPRESFMLIALPNLDGSFTVTLFLQYEGPVSFENLNTDEEIMTFFKKYFPTALEHIPHLLEEFRENPTASLVTVKCDPWHYKNACLLGDAAHAIVPFYGQGMNAGFEDCFVLNSIIDKHDNEDWDVIFEEFSEIHAKNGQAIADLALRHFIEMRDDTADDHFLQRKKLELHLMEQYPNQYKSQYQMVTFSHTPYSEALEKGDKQTVEVEAFLDKYPNKEDWETEAFKNEISTWLSKNA